MAVIDFPTKLFLKEEASPFFAESVLRYLPGKRIVLKGMWMERPVVAKLFFPHRNIQKHIARERKGYKLLCERDLLTPALVWQGDSEACVIQNKKIIFHVFLFQYIVPTAPCEIDEALIALIARQHQVGVYQTDCHQYNYLNHHGMIYSVDLASFVGKAFAPLSRKDSLNNLALYFAQMGRLFSHAQQHLLKRYCDLRGWHVDDDVLLQIRKAFEKANRALYRERLAKVTRESSEFSCKKTGAYRAIVRRDHESQRLDAFLADPELFMQQGEIIKAGGASTVVKTWLDGQEVVIKRYNIKSFFHGLKRLFQCSRARRSWVNAYRLKHLNIATPLAIAMLEKKCWGLKREAYLITRYEKGVVLKDYLQTPYWSVEKLALIEDPLLSLFVVLKHYHLVHGDLKATNFLMNNEKLWLTDLDSLKEVRLFTEKDKRRFLENWRQTPELLHWFEAIFSRVSESVDGSDF